MVTKLEHDVDSAVLCIACWWSVWLLRVSVPFDRVSPCSGRLFESEKLAFKVIDISPTLLFSVAEASARKRSTFSYCLKRMHVTGLLLLKLVQASCLDEGGHQNSGFSEQEHPYLPLCTPQITHIHLRPSFPRLVRPAYLLAYTQSLSSRDPLAVERTKSTLLKASAAACVVHHGQRRI